MVKNTLSVLALSITLVGCADGQGKSKSDESVVNVAGKLCVPVEYAIKTDDVGLPAGGDDPDSPGLDTSVAFSSSEVAKSITHYAVEMVVGDKKIPQDLFVMFKPETIVWNKGNTDYAHPVSGVKGLVRRDSSSLAWTVTSGDSPSASYWGSCTDYFEDKSKFECLRQYQFEGLQFEYTLESDNISLYHQIDQFLVNKFFSWKCP